MIGPGDRRASTHRSPGGILAIGGVLLLVVVLTSIGLALFQSGRLRSRDQVRSAPPPPGGGYFQLANVGSWQVLPASPACAAQVRRSTWEPRPENETYNRTVPDPAAVRSSFSRRPMSDEWVNWNSWLLPRVDGSFIGTTDEILQWAACKWGLSDDLIRAIAAAESTWYQYLTDSDGRCRDQMGCGDFWASDPVYCRAISQYGYNYEVLDGRCPGTFSIAGVMAFQHPTWGLLADHQNGTFPFSRDSTAFAVDYLGATIRGCYEGWMVWLQTPFPTYGSGDLWGCVGVWYSGEWRTSRGTEYSDKVKRLAGTAPWRNPDW